MRDTVSLELAKKLKEAGWKQDAGDWHWVTAGGSGHVAMRDGLRDKLWPRPIFDGLCQTAVCRQYYAAPTIGDLAHALPMDIHIDKLKGEDGRGCYRVTLEQDEKMDYDCMEETLADTLGECMVRLMKDGYKPYV